LYGNAYFFEGGTLTDKNDKLVADWGQYNTSTREAVFYYNVKLRSGKNTVTTDTLHYFTRESLAHAVGPTVITSDTTIVNTTDAWLESDSDLARLFGRSTIVDGKKTIVGDTLLHNNTTGENMASGNVVYTDEENKNALTCDYAEYNEKTGFGYATGRALLRDYSQGDTLYLHSDTMKIVTYNIETDSVRREVHAYSKVKVYRSDVQAVCDSLVFTSVDSCLTMYRDPIVWNGSQQLFGEQIRVYMKDSTIHRAHVIGQAFSTEQMPDTIHFNQVSSKEMFAFFEKGEIYETDAVGNVLIVYYPVDESDSTLIGLNYTETPKMKMFLEKRKMKKIWMEKPTGTLYPMTQIPPAKYFLPQYAWFDYIRPLNKDDIFNWRSKNAGQELKEIKRREAPKQKVTRKENL
jgi:lipopolysaccharide export system protein LptA